MEQSKAVQIIKSKRVIALFIALIIALIAINPNPWRDGISVKSVEKGSVAEIAGVKPGEAILAVNDQQVSTVSEFTRLTSNLEVNKTFLIETKDNFYKLTVKPLGNTTVSNYTEQPSSLGITAALKSKTNIKTGLDLQGGTRVLLQPEEKLDTEDLEFLIENMNRRLNLFGLADVSVRDASDFSGQQYVMVEVAGVNENEVKELISRQGKFEAKVGNLSVFKGSDVIDVCRSAHCSGIDYQSGGCQSLGPANWMCPYFFSISLSQEAAKRQANATSDLQVIDGYLSEQLYLYLDDELVDTLSIGESLRGQASTSVQISGTGSGTTSNTATKDAVRGMKQLQTILITGSLPVKLEIVRTDSVSPLLGEKFVQNAMLTGISAIVAVVIILFVAYRSFAVAIPIMIISLAEIFLLLGVAALIRWNIDLAAIAGIIAAVGTGVNDQIIITDEALRGEMSKLTNWKLKLKSAFSVIMGAYFTLLFAMIPLFLIGAGLLRGFAVTTIIGITVGVFLTRPAYAKIIEILTQK